LSPEAHVLLEGRLTGLWGAASAAEAFESWSVDKQQALLLLLTRIRALELWHLVKRVTNIYGEGGVGLQFEAWPMIESTLERRKDFTRRFANHNDTTGGFYERERAEVILHFLYQDGDPRIWYVHFDLYSPVHSLTSLFQHLRYEFIGKMKLDWRIVAKYLNS
jgi:hypothetical protein